MLVRLLYASRAADTSPGIVEAIHAHARDHNPAAGITGILCHGRGVFLQAIEGARPAVNALYAALLRDARHTDLELLLYEEIVERRFGGWTMGLVNLSRLNASLVLKYSATPALDPYGLPGRSSLALLQELADTAAVAARG